MGTNVRQILTHLIAILIPRHKVANKKRPATLNWIRRIQMFIENGITANLRPWRGRTILMTCHLTNCTHHRIIIFRFRIRILIGLGRGRIIASCCYHCTLLLPLPPTKKSFMIFSLRDLKNFAFIASLAWNQSIFIITIRVTCAELVEVSAFYLYIRGHSCNSWLSSHLMLSPTDYQSPITIFLCASFVSFSPDGTRFKNVPSEQICFKKSAKIITICVISVLFSFPDLLISLSLRNKRNRPNPNPKSEISIQFNRRPCSWLKFNGAKNLTWWMFKKYRGYDPVKTAGPVSASYPC